MARSSVASAQSVSGCFVAYRGAVAAVARAGINVIVDEVLLGEDDWKGWQDQLGGLDVMWVAVTPDLDVVEQRERDRNDRMIGLARSQHDVVHRHAVYDVRVDTAVMDPGYRSCRDSCRQMRVCGADRWRINRRAFSSNVTQFVH